MTTTTVLCDLCKEAVTSDRHLLTAASGSLRNRRPETDLCPGCFALFLAWLERDRQD